MVGFYFYHESNIDGKCRDNRGNSYRRIFQQCIDFKRDFLHTLQGITDRDNGNNKRRY